MMKLHFLGMGAADWNGPDERGEYRRFTSTLVGENLLIDVTQNILPQIQNRDAITSILMRCGSLRRAAFTRTKVGQRR